MKWVIAFYQDIFVSRGRDLIAGMTYKELPDLDKLMQIESVVIHTQMSGILCERISRALQHCKNVACHVAFYREEFQQFYLFMEGVGWKISALCAICCFVFIDSPRVSDLSCISMEFTG